MACGILSWLAKALSSKSRAPVTGVTYRLKRELV
jgi:hypothetical protein